MYTDKEKNVAGFTINERNVDQLVSSLGQVEIY